MSEPIFWACDDRAELTDTDMDEAIEQHLDCLWPTLHEHKGNERECIAAFLAGLPKEIEVYGFTRAEVSRNIAQFDPDDFLSEFAAGFDERNEELADAFGDTVALERMTAEGREKVKAACAAFLQTFLDEYVPWACERTTTVKLDPVAWIKEHRPDWLVPDEPEQPAEAVR